MASGATVSGGGGDDVYLITSTLGLVLDNPTGEDPEQITIDDTSADSHNIVRFDNDVGVVEFFIASGVFLGRPDIVEIELANGTVIHVENLPGTRFQLGANGPLHTAQQFRDIYRDGFAPDSVAASLKIPEYAGAGAVVFAAVETGVAGNYIRIAVAIGTAAGTGVESVAVTGAGGRTERHVITITTHAGGATMEQIATAVNAHAAAGADTASASALVTATAVGAATDTVTRAESARSLFGGLDAVASVAVGIAAPTDRFIDGATAPQEGGTLTADVADPRRTTAGEGTTVSWQWQYNANNGPLGWADIDGAEDRTFTIPDDTHTGQYIRVVVTYRDGNNNIVERVTSDPAGAVLDVNTPPSPAADTGAATEGATDATTGNVITGAGPLNEGRDTDDDTGDTALLKVSRAAVGDGFDNAAAFAAAARAVPADGSALTLAGAYGTLKLKKNGAYEYAADNAGRLAHGAAKEDVFTYEVSDGKPDGTATTTLTVTVTGVNDAPVVDNASLAYDGGEASVVVLTTNLLATDVDSDDGAGELTYRLTGAVAGGTLKLGTAVLGNGDSFTQQDVADGLLTFEPSDEPLPEGQKAGFGFTVEDGREDGIPAVEGRLRISRRTEYELPPEEVDGHNVVDLPDESSSVDTGDGFDTINAGAGDDAIHGGDGNDRINLDGGGDDDSSDTVFYKFGADGQAVGGADRITGFRRGEDRLVFVEDKPNSSDAADIGQFLASVGGANPDRLGDDLFAVEVTYTGSVGSFEITGLFLHFQSAGRFANGTRLSGLHLHLLFDETMDPDGFLDLIGGIGNIIPDTTIIKNVALDVNGTPALLNLLGPHSLGFQAAVNDPATGLELGGNTAAPVAGETLTANIDDIADEDGLASDVVYSYQWRESSDNGGTWADIDGAVEQGYRLRSTQKDNLVRVVVTFVDEDDNAEELTAQTEAAVVFATARADAVFNPLPDDLRIPENEAGPVSIGSPVKADDANGQTVTYGLQDAPAAFADDFEIDTATGQISYVGSGLDYEALASGSAIRMTVAATSTGENGSATTITQPVAIEVEDVNDAPVLAARSLQVASGGTHVLTDDNLHASDEDDSDENITFTLTVLPGHGNKLQLKGDWDDDPSTPDTWRDLSAADGNNSFTQQDIADLRVQYVNTGGTAAGDDSFMFTVVDDSPDSDPVTGTFNIDIV